MFLAVAAALQGVPSEALGEDTAKLYVHIETPSPGPGGYKGVGEGGAIGAPPAVVNAVADALSPFGVTITELPLGPSQILALLEEGEA